jgi:hypothetical protein
MNSEDTKLPRMESPLVLDHAIVGQIQGVEDFKRWEYFDCIMEAWFGPALVSTSTSDFTRRC